MNIDHVQNKALWSGEQKGALRLRREHLPNDFALDFSGFTLAARHSSRQAGNGIRGRPKYARRKVSNGDLLRQMVHWRSDP